MCRGLFCDMGQIFRFPKTVLPNLVYVFLVPVFFIAFCMVYNPFDIQGFYASVGVRPYTFHLVLIACIQIASLSICRIIFYFLNRHLSFPWWWYVAWCVFELCVISAFMALYTTLFFGARLLFFPAFSQCFKYTCLILVYPYLLLILVRLCMNASADLKESGAVAEDSLAKFYDEHHRLKMSTDPRAVLYVSAELNYVTVHYLDNGTPREFLLRASMKSIEQNPSCKFLVRCHRSYFVNPAHIRLLGRNKMGVITAELTGVELDPVPVSKQYYDRLSELI